MTIEEIGRWLQSNPWAVTVLAIVGVAGLLVTSWGFFVTIRGIRVRKPRYGISTNVLLEGAKDRFPELKVKHVGAGNELQDNLSVALVAFWNAGRETIRKADLAEKDPLRIQGLGKGVILGCSVLQ